MYALFDFGADARYVVACASAIRASGMPTNSTACIAPTATASPRGSAFPMSSEADITSRRAMNLGSSPAISILASQYTAASGSDPRIDFMNAEIVS